MSHVQPTRNHVIGDTASMICRAKHHCQRQGLSFLVMVLGIHHQLASSSLSWQIKRLKRRVAGCTVHGMQIIRWLSLLCSVRCHDAAKHWHSAGYFAAACPTKEQSRAASVSSTPRTFPTILCSMSCNDCCNGPCKMPLALPLPLPLLPSCVPITYVHLTT